MKKNIRYTHVKSLRKRIRQGFFRFLIYGSLLVAGEVAFYTLTKIGRSIDLVKILFQYNWLIDPILKLGHMWDVPINTLYGQASLYMFFVYGAICVFGLEPAFRFMKRKGIPLLLRGFVYMFIILFMECSLGWILYWITGFKIWYYEGPGTILTFTSLAIGPMWYICGLISENVINLIHSFEELKMSVYGLDKWSQTREKNQKKDKIVIMSDIHIGQRDPNGKSTFGWFKDMYRVYFTIILHKLARDERIKELVFLGDLFDTWVYPPEMKPDSIPQLLDIWKEAEFMAPLKQCIKNIDKVYYIAGNHDMRLTQEDVQSLSVEGKTLKVISLEDYNKEHHLENNCELLVEHGNNADLFNAPYEKEDAIHGYPFGYYLARLAVAAQGCNTDKLIQDSYKQALLKSRQQGSNNEVKNESLGNLFNNLMIDTLVAKTNKSRLKINQLNNDSEIIMPGDLSPVTIKQLREGYGSLMSEIFSKKDRKYMFAAVGKNGLNEYARKKFGAIDWTLWFKRIFKANKPELIVVFGHTHYSIKTMVMNREKQGIYLNSGCCCSCSKEAGARWIEITEEPKLRARVKKI